MIQHMKATQSSSSKHAELSLSISSPIDPLSVFSAHYVSLLLLCFVPPNQHKMILLLQPINLTPPENIITRQYCSSSPVCTTSLTIIQ